MDPFDSGAGDSAARLIAVLLTLAAMGSEPLGHLWPFAAYSSLLFTLAWHWQIPAWEVLRQPLRLAPLLIMLALGLPASRMLDSWFAGNASGIGFDG
ncbi:MAG: hypothetical protein KIT83_04765, partial [Bryobacterales bacterium]|nr:hypothetical protein [Bryobacterales bacterium]